MRRLTFNHGFGSTELFVALAILSLMVLISIPNFFRAKEESQYTTVEAELDTLKIAVITFWKHNNQSYPVDISSSLISSSPSIIGQTLDDPWKTDLTQNTYGYFRAKDATFGDYFIIYTRGPRADTNPIFNATTQQVEYTGSGRVVSNAPIQRIPSSH